MIAPIATSLRCLSSLSLALSSIADPTSDALQSRADHLSNLIGWANFTVAVGVAMEGVEILHAIVVWGMKKRRERRERLEFKELSKIFPTGEWERPADSHPDEPQWVKRLLRVGIIIVVIGVVVEWQCGAKLEDAHNAIHRYDLEKIGDAATSAKTAHDEANGAKLASNEAITEAEKAQIASSGAFALSRQAQQESGALKHDLALTKKQAEDVAKQLAPRTLNPGDWEAIGDKLRPFARQFAGRKVSLSSYALDTEAIVFSVEISKIFERAGIDIDPHIGGVLQSGIIDTGVHITGPVSDKDFIILLGREIHERADTDVSGEWNGKYSNLTVDVLTHPIAGLPKVIQPQ